jgi:serine/threonine protein kinase
LFVFNYSFVIITDKEKAGNLVNEALLMMDFKHENVMTLYGFTLKDDKPYLLLPWMENGDILTFIRKKEVWFN